MKLIKLFGIGVFSVSILLAILYIFLLFVVPNIVNVNNYKNQISEQVEKNTGLSFSAEDIDLKLEFSPYLNLSAHHVKLLYPTGETFVKINDAKIKIRVLPILFKRIEISKVILVRPIVSLTLYSDCSTSLEKYLKPVNSEPSLLYGFKLVNKIPNIQLNRYKLKIKDVNLYSPFILEGDRLLLEDFDINKNKRIRTKGILSSNDRIYINYDLDIDTYLEEFKNKKFFKVSPFKTIIKYDVHTDVFAHLKVKQKEKTPEIEGVLNLDKLSLRINNKLLKNNFINLKFSSQNIEILSKVCTSLKDRADISGTVSYGRKKNIDLKVKALNANISDLEELMVATLDTLNIKNQFRDYSASGTANLDFQIKSNFKKLESRGKAQILDATIISRLASFKITNINSNISFSNNEIKILNAKALVNSTPLTIEGKISDTADVNIIISGNSLPLPHLIKMFVVDKSIDKYDIEKGILSFKAGIKGKLNKLSLKVDAKVDNLSLKDKQNNFILTLPLSKISFNSEGNLYSGQASLTNLDLSSPSLKTKISSKNLVFNFTPKELIFNQGSLLLNNSPLTFKGNVINYLETPDYEFDFKGKLSANELYKYFSSHCSLKASAKGYLPVIGNIKGDFKKAKSDVQIVADNSNYVSFLVIKELLGKPSLLNISLDIKNNSAEVSDLSLYKLAANLQLSESLHSNLSKAVRVVSLTGKIFDLNKIKFDNLKLSVPESLTFSVSGLRGSEVSVKTDIILNGSLISPSIEGNLNINGLKLPEYNIKSENINLVFNNSNIYLRAPELNVNNSKFDIIANISPKFDKKITVKDVKLVSSNFDLPSVASSFSALSNSPTSQGFIVPLEIITGKANIANFVATGIRTSNVVTDFELHNNLLKIKNMTTDAYNGKVWGNIDYNFLYAKTGINLLGRSLDVAPAVLSLTGIKDDITGKLDFSINANMYGYSRHQQMQSLKGKAKITIHNGQLGTLGKFEHFLYAQNLVSQSIMKSTVNVIAQAVTSKNTGRFKYLNADITFSNGYADIGRLEFSGPNMSMLLSGKLNLLNNWANFEILGKVSQEVTNVLGPLGELSLSNIVSNVPRLNNVSLPNIFFGNFNLQVSPSVIESIPSLTPRTDLKTKNFTVKILGNIENVKSVKSFKWLVLKSAMPQIEQSTHTTPVEMTKPLSPTVQQAPSVKPVRKQQPELPSFLDSLPDTIK